MIDARKALDNLADALVEDLMSLTDEEIRAEALEDGIDIEQNAKEMRLIFEAARYKAAAIRAQAWALQWKRAAKIGHKQQLAQYEMALRFMERRRITAQQRDEARAERDEARAEIDRLRALVDEMSATVRRLEDERRAEW